MTRLTPVFLVLLRLAIGWHFLFEGVDKLNHPTWTSAGYLRESGGPLAGRFNELAGDPVLIYCEIAPMPAGSDSAPVPASQQLPPTLAREWDNWFDRYAAYYKLEGDDLANAKRQFDQRKSQTGSWLRGEGENAKKSIDKSAFGVTVPVMQSVPERVAEYKKLVKDLNTLQTKERDSFVTGANAKLAGEKAKIAKARADLLADLDEQTLEMKKSLRELLPVTRRAQRLTDELRDQRFAKQDEKQQVESANEVKQGLLNAIEKQRKQRDELGKKIPEIDANNELSATEKEVEKKRINDQIAAIPTKIAELNDFLADFREEENPAVRGGLAAAPVASEPNLKGFLPEETAPSWHDWSWLKWDRLQWADFSVRYGLTAVGICLILGLFTRTSCVAGAGFLTLFYLAMMPLPWLPENPKAEGHYLYINKNIIEMLALLALATTASGRWVGLDGLVHYFSPFRRRKGVKKPAVKKTLKALDAVPHSEREPATANGTHTNPHEEPAEIGTTLTPTHPERAEPHGD